MIEQSRLIGHRGGASDDGYLEELLILYLRFLMIDKFCLLRKVIWNMGLVIYERLRDFLVKGLLTDIVINRVIEELRS